jgi:hypothetical protein
MSTSPIVPPITVVWSAHNTRLLALVTLSLTMIGVRGRVDLVDFLDQFPKSCFDMLIIMLRESLELEQECKASVYCLQLLRHVIVGQSAVQYSPAVSGIPDRGFTPIRIADGLLQAIDNGVHKLPRE